MPGESELQWSLLGHLNLNRKLITVRWIARILSGFILLFWGFFMVAHLVGGAGQASRALTTSDRLGFTMMLLSLFGLGIAWRWELIGAGITLAATLILALLNPHAVTGLGLLPPITALGFLFCWWGRQASHNEKDVS